MNFFRNVRGIDPGGYLLVPPVKQEETLKQDFTCVFFNIYYYDCNYFHLVASISLHKMDEGIKYAY